MSRLNYFLPYESKPNHYEDNLTRAFLVALRFSSAAQIQFYQLVRDQVQTRSSGYGNRPTLPTTQALPWNEVWLDTQATNLRARKASFIISIVLTDEPLIPIHTIQVTERSARYDGLFAIGEEALLIIENKPRDYGFWAEQMNPSSHDVDSEATTVIPVPVSLEWNQLIQMLRMVQKISGISEPERLIIEDFFTYVNSNFPSLNPYRTFGECQNAPQLIDRRIQKVLAEIAGDEDKAFYHKGWGRYIVSGMAAAQKAALRLEQEPESPAEWSLTLDYSAGDTINQARHLYRNPNLASSIEQLRRNGWGVSCGFHLSFMSSNLVWLKTADENIMTYIEYWSQHNDKLRQYPKHELQAFLDELASKGILDLTKAGPELKEKIFSKNYATLNICPSLYIQHYFTTSEVIELDSKGLFVDEVRRQMAIAKLAIQG